MSQTASGLENNEQISKEEFHGLKSFLKNDTMCIKGWDTTPFLYKFEKGESHTLKSVGGASVYVACVNDETEKAYILKFLCQDLEFCYERSSCYLLTPVPGEFIRVSLENEHVSFQIPDMLSVTQLEHLEIIEGSGTEAEMHFSDTISFTIDIFDNDLRETALVWFKKIQDTRSNRFKNAETRELTEEQCYSVLQAILSSPLVLSSSKQKSARMVNMEQYNQHTSELTANLERNTEREIFEWKSAASEIMSDDKRTILQKHVKDKKRLGNYSQSILN